MQAPLGGAGFDRPTGRRYRRVVWNLADRLPSPPTLLRIGLVVFVLAWLFGPYWLQSAIPIWLPFLIALGLEIHFFVGALRQPPGAAPGSRAADQRPRAVRLRRRGAASRP